MCLLRRRRHLLLLVVLLLLAGTWLLYISFSAIPGPYASKGGKLILMSYGRSGSSFTAKIISRHPDVFYTFEPLYNLQHRHSKDIQELYRRNTHCNYSPAEYHKESASIMEVFLSCSFETMNSKDIDNFQLRNSEGSRLLWLCVQQKDKLNAVDVIDCFINARKTCASRSVKMVKTIRFRGSAAAEMMVRHEDLKIIYLVRDPRGTILSQQKVFKEFNGTQIVNFTTYFCQTFREDLANLEPLFDKYPDRIKLLRYETLAENPTKVSEELYKFLRLTFTARVKEFVYNSTSAGKSSKGNYDTFKANSTKAAYAWRNGTVFKEVQVIDKICGDIYLKLGYLPVISIHELEDRHHPLKRDINFHRNSI